MRTLSLWIAAGLIMAIWLGAVASGLVVIATYGAQGSESGGAPKRWPEGSTLPHRHGAANLVLFLHPQCPCSSGTLTELNRILARTDGACGVTVAIYAPTCKPPEWNHSALRSKAEAIPGARVVDDIDGREAKRFGAVLSGHLLAYDGMETLRFQGGITASRGHEGDNLGEDCVLAILRGQPPRVEHTPTYGCEILTAPGDTPCPLCKEEGTP